MKKEEIKDNQNYYFVNSYYYVMKQSAELLKFRDVNYENVYENEIDAKNKLLQNLEEYALNEIDIENKNIALYNIEQIKQKILNSGHLAIFKLFKQKELK